jgi:hypothetical protein
VVEKRSGEPGSSAHTVPSINNFVIIHYFLFLVEHYLSGLTQVIAQTTSMTAGQARRIALVLL